MFKKITIFSLILLDVFLVTNSTLAAPNLPPPATTPPLLGVDLAGQKGPNPAPPIGLTPCGKTMCNENEICVKYPHDKDEHCAPKETQSIVDMPPYNWKPDLPPDCWKELGEGKGTFPPNDKCWNHFKNVQSEINKFQKTCIYQPVVQYTSTRLAVGNDQDQPFIKCGNGPVDEKWSWGVPGGSDPECAVSMLVYTDVRDATLGSYGPSAEERSDKSSDFIAQNYLYSSLFERPNNLTDGSEENNRESYRTYWRLLPASNQANLRSFILNMANDKQLDDIHFEFTDSNGGKNETSFQKLYDGLKTQVILFWHWPFIRIGCLVDYPVCPEFAQAIDELKPNLESLTNSILKAVPTNIDATLLNKATAALGLNLDGAYTAFTPLDFNSLRAYIVRKADQKENDYYTDPFWEPKLKDDKNASRYGNKNKPPLGLISKENLPYLAAIYQGLLSPKYGIIPSVQPSWVSEKYTTKESDLYDYKAGNKPEDYPEVKISKKNVLENAKNEITAVSTNPFGWIKEKVTGLFKDEDTKLNGYNPPNKGDDDAADNEDGDIKSAYVNFKSCPLPVSYHILSPKTAAKTPYDHHQVVTINGTHLQWAYNPESFPTTIPCYNSHGKAIPGSVCGCSACQDTMEQFHHDGDDCTCYKRKWNVTGIEDGKALTVLNNPKQTDIKNAVVQNDKYSLFKTLLPDAVSKKKITDASIDAPVAYHFSSYLAGGGTATSPNGTSKVFNPAEPINRINNRAQDTMHLLQNCWTVPEKLQNSPRCKLALVDNSNKETCDGKLFQQMFPSLEPVSSKGESVYSQVKGQVTEGDLQAYAEAEKQTGVPCEVLAAIHYREGDNDESKDLQSGGDLGGRSLTESAVQAANELLAKVGGKLDSIENLMRALSWYNGGGNANCQAMNSADCPYAVNGFCGSTVSCSSSNTAACTCTSLNEGEPEPGSCRALCTSGFPFKIPSPSAGLCPPKSTGFDDPYVTELWQSPFHDNMYVLYSYDCTATSPIQQNRLGTLPYAILFNKELTSK